MKLLKRLELIQSLPDTSTRLTLKGLESKIEIIRDKFGIPHIKALSNWDSFFGQGFATAQDRMWHMDLDRHRAYGRWAELVGESGIEQDVMMRRFRLRQSAHSDYKVLEQPTLNMLNAYSAGVNAFIDTTQSMPIEYSLLGAYPERWEPWDSLAILKVRHIFMGTFESKVWRAKLLKFLGPEKASALLPGYESGQDVMIPPGGIYSGDGNDALEELSKAADNGYWLKESDSGSNSWVLGGDRTASGKPLLSGDPHRGLDTPNVYYQNHISSEDFDSIGLSFPGVPGFPHFGHNEHVAWCVTHTGADYQDLFVEKFRGDKQLQYKYKEKWLEAFVEPEQIGVNGATPIQIDVVSTRHGPVVSGNPRKGEAITFMYSATSEPNKAAGVLLKMLLSRNTKGMEEAIREWVDPCNNFLFADVKGGFGYRTRGKLPVRSKANGWLPVPGWTGEHEWQGMVPFEEMPNLHQPKQGYIVTANNKVIDDSYPHYIALEFAPGFRANRIQERLMGLEKATVSDMAAIHNERVSIPGSSFAQLASSITTSDKLAERAKSILMNWDGVVSKESVAATIYNSFRDNLVKLILTPYLGSLSEEAFGSLGRGGPAHVGRLKSKFHSMIEVDDRRLLPEGSDWISQMDIAFSDTVNGLKERLGSDISNWEWANVHQTRPVHPLSAVFPEISEQLNPPSVPMGGDADTPHAASYAMAEPFTVIGMSVARYIFDLSDWSNSRWIVPLGSSGHPGSEHYADQSQIWGDVDYIPMVYNWSEIEEQAESRQELFPANNS